MFHYLRSLANSALYGDGRSGSYPAYPERMAEEESPNYRELALRDLRPMNVPVMVVARILTVERREIVRKSDGGRRPVLSGLLTDGTATVRFTWWDPPEEEIDPGMVLRAVNVQVREFRGKPELSFNFRTRVGPASESELPAVEPEPVSVRPISDLRPGEEEFGVEARVVEVRAKLVSLGTDRRPVHEGVLADSSGAIGFSSWTDFSLVRGETIRVTGGRLRSFRGMPQLVLEERTSVTRIPAGSLPTPESVLDAEPVPLGLLALGLKSPILTAEGTVVGVVSPSGLVYRCPVCRRILSHDECRVHGARRGEPDLRARLVLDDGTGTVTVGAGREATEKLLGRTLGECAAQPGAESELAPFEEALFEATFGKRFRVRGWASRDDFGVTIVPEVFDLLDGDPAGLEPAYPSPQGPGAS